MLFEFHLGIREVKYQCYHLSYHTSVPTSSISISLAGGGFTSESLFLPLAELKDGCPSNVGFRSGRNNGFSDILLCCPNVSSSLKEADSDEGV
mmetsp:Transcript_34159/g.40190  ORF Transcript_34159/g.40190 Transcript_34159/m.40190 type:complete len:93 (+) Transcript_34159:225-503(+)